LRGIFATSEISSIVRGSPRIRQAIKMAREQGIKAGLFRPVTLWPYPLEALSNMSEKAKKIFDSMQDGESIFENAVKNHS
jgi:pyruvate/2-oxoacid:ferredoxin oxidoreductase alpha subunit